MVEQLLEELGVALTPDIATCLYTGLVFDTGRFMHSNSGPAEFNCAARLVAVGIDAATINRRLCYTKTPDDLAAQALGLQSLDLAAEGKIAGIALTGEQMAGLPNVQDWGELVELPRSLQGVEIAYIMRQQPDGAVRCSLRSNPPYCVAPVAQQFDGGGHQQAAGCTITGYDLAEARQVLIAALSKALAAN